MAENTSQKPSKPSLSARGTRIYCTQNEHVQYEKTCIICGKKFIAKSEKAKVCSERCQYQVKKARKKAQQSAQQQIGSLTPAQQKAIQDAGGIETIANTPIGELTTSQKTLGWLSLGLAAWIIIDETQKRKRQLSASRRRKA